MSNKLKLASSLELPLDIAGQAAVLLGIRGSGKTNTAAVIAEELLDQNQPLIVIDPTDAWWGLRSGRDGRSGGYPIFIFGGSHGDLPLNETDGKVIAEFIVKERVSVVLSLRHLRKNAQRRFVTEFCEELYHLKGDDRTALTVIIDEAPLFAPNKVQGDMARTVGAIEDLIARGRTSGFGVILISQRSATLNADIRTQADTMVCHRVVAKLDRKAVRDWFEENASEEKMDEILTSLATLKNGEAWIWSPMNAIMRRVHIRLRSTFDSSATPKVGQTAASPKRLADVDLGKLREKMQSAVEQVMASDPKLLRARVAKLEAELNAARSQKPVAVKTVEPQVVQRSVDKAVETAKRQMLAKVKQTFGPMVGFMDGIRIKLTGMVPAGKDDFWMEWGFDDIETARVTVETANMFAREEVRRVTRNDPPPKILFPEDDGDRLSGPAVKIIQALMQIEALRIPRAPRTLLCVMVGYSNTASTGFAKALSKLSSRGFIVYPAPSEVALTDAGRALMNAPDAPITRRELHDQILNLLGGKKAEVLKILLDAGEGHSVSRDALMRDTGYTHAASSGFVKALSTLSGFGLITYPGKGTVAAAEFLFI